MSTVKVKAPFKLTYDGPGKIRCWCYGLGHLVGWPSILEWGYNIAGCSWRLPIGVTWKWIRSKSTAQIEKPA